MSRIRVVLFVLFATSPANAREVLIVGDSLTCGPFGKYLAQDQMKRGHSVTLYCTVSSAPSHWMNGTNPQGQKCQTMRSPKLSFESCGQDGQLPKFESILAAHSGARVILALGTNSLGSTVADSNYKKMVNAVAQRRNACDWIGPPQLSASQSKGFPVGRVEALSRNLNSFYESLAVTVGKHCHLIDSRDATAPGRAGSETTDGVHRTESAGKAWVDQISAKLNGLPNADTSSSATN